MPRYSYSLEDGTRLTHPEATEDFPDDKAAMDHARKVARDFSGSLSAMADQASWSGTKPTRKSAACHLWVWSV